ncbi:hypothetical protein GCM10027592_04560 [Spirosoma flavus]
MTRPNEFSKSTIADALQRQNGRCGICGENVLVLGRKFNAHHITSAKYGGTDSLDNCVILCDEDEDGWRGGGCHLFAHGDSFRRAFELNRSEYIYING